MIPVRSQWGRCNLPNIFKPCLYKLKLGSPFLVDVALEQIRQTSPTRQIPWAAVTPTALIPALPFRRLGRCGEARLGGPSKFLCCVVGKCPNLLHGAGIYAPTLHPKWPSSGQWIMEHMGNITWGPAYLAIADLMIQDELLDDWFYKPKWKPRNNSQHLTTFIQTSPKSQRSFEPPPMQRKKQPSCS